MTRNSIEHEFVGRRWILYIFSFVSVSMAAGIIYGWPALRKQLQDEQQQLATTTKSPHNLTEETLGAIFTVGAWTTQGGRFFTGWARDRWGTRNVATGCMMMVSLGCLGVAWANPHDSNNNNNNNRGTIMLGISVFFIGLGSGVQLCVQAVAGLFPQSSGTILSSLAGAFQVSGLIFLILTSGHPSSSSSPQQKRRVNFTCYAIALGVLSVMAFFLLPKGTSFAATISTQNNNKDDDAVDESDPPSNQTVDDSRNNNNNNNNADCKKTYQKKLGSSDHSESEQDMDETKGTQASSSFCFTCNNNDGDDIDTTDDGESGQATSNPEDSPTTVHNKNKSVLSSSSSHSSKSKITDENGEINMEETEGATSSASSSSPNPPTTTAMDQIKSLEFILLCTWFSITLIPMQYYVGSIGFQFQQKGDTTGFYTNLFSMIYASATIVSPIGGWISDKWGLGVTQGLATWLCAASYVVLALPLQGRGGSSSSSSSAWTVQIVGIILYGIGRLLVFGMYFANCGKRFGYVHFGTLAGLGLLISALVSLVQYPMIAWAARGQAQEVNLASAIAMVLQSPYFVWLYRRERQQGPS